MLITGTITRIEDHGTIVILFIDNTPIYFDHTPFRWLYEMEAGNLIGRTATFDGENLQLDSTITGTKEEAE
jgi:hypothetical protein